MGVDENDPAKSKESNSSSPKMYLVNLHPVLCIVSAAPEGGLLGFGLLGGGGSSTSTSRTTTASSSDNSGIIQNLIDVLTGKVATIALDQLSNLLGLNNPVPSPLSDPVGFLTHPLISPIILAAVTLNPPALALAMGGLAGNLVLTHIFTIATKHLSAPLWQ